MPWLLPSLKKLFHIAAVASWQPSPLPLKIDWQSVTRAEPTPPHQNLQTSLDLFFHPPLFLSLSLSTGLKMRRVSVTIYIMSQTHLYPTPPFLNKIFLYV